MFLFVPEWENRLEGVAPPTADGQLGPVFNALALLTASTTCVEAKKSQFRAGMRSTGHPGVEGAEDDPGRQARAGTAAGFSKSREPQNASGGVRGACNEKGFARAGFVGRVEADPKMARPASEGGAHAIRIRELTATKPVGGESPWYRFHFECASGEAEKQGKSGEVSLLQTQDFCPHVLCNPAKFRFPH